MGSRIWVGGAVALLLVGGVCFVMPQLGGLALILLSLGAVAVVAFRLL